MFKAVGAAAVPLVLAVGVLFGKQLDPVLVAQYTDAVTLLLGLVGTAICAYFPSIRAKLKFGEDAK